MVEDYLRSKPTNAEPNWELGRRAQSRRVGIIPAALVAMFCIANCAGYSVFAHEALIDVAWKDDIEPLLLKRFPNASLDDLREARAFAYGGTLIQDLGYYPFGSRFFSDLAHYVRTGDFVQALITESRDLDEYAFALGALGHYASDNSGHQVATNFAVGMMYPKLVKKYGPSVTYEESPSAHMKVEFGFDVDQVAEGHYAPSAYHDYIGFEVSEPLLERAFAKTYALDLSDVFLSVDLVIGTYRHTVSKLIPRMTKVAWHLKKDEIQNSDPSETKAKFLYNVSKSDYRTQWGRLYEDPGFFTRVRAFFFRLTPKVGPFSALAFHPPTPAMEQLYFESFNQALDRYRALLLDEREDRLHLPNQNLDTGGVTVAAGYRLADETYAEWLGRLAGKQVSSDVRDDILAYYADLGKEYATKQDSRTWKQLCRELDVLKSTRSR